MNICFYLCTICSQNLELKKNKLTRSCEKGVFFSENKAFFFQNGKKFFYCPPPPPTHPQKYPKKERTFFFFRNFHCRVCFLVTKNVFCHQKVTKLCSENFEKWKTFSPFWGIFFLFGGTMKKNFQMVKNIFNNFSKSSIEYQILR